MSAKVLMMTRAGSAEGVELSAFDREIQRQERESDRRAARIADLPDDWQAFPTGCRWVGHETDNN